MSSTAAAAVDHQKLVNPVGNLPFSGYEEENDNRMIGAVCVFESLRDVSD